MKRKISIQDISWRILLDGNNGRPSIMGKSWSHSEKHILKELCNNKIHKLAIAGGEVIYQTRETVVYHICKHRENSLEMLVKRGLECMI